VRFGSPSVCTDSFPIGAGDQPPSRHSGSRSVLMTVHPAEKSRSLVTQSSCSHLLVNRSPRQLMSWRLYSTPYFSLKRALMDEPSFVSTVTL
jgi:hypothetical protein